MFFGSLQGKVMTPHITEMIEKYAVRPSFLLNGSVGDLCGLLRVISSGPDDLMRVSGSNSRVCELVADMSKLQSASFLEGFYPDVSREYVDSVLAFLLLYPSRVNSDHLKYFHRPLNPRVYRTKV